MFTFVFDQIILAANNISEKLLTDQGISKTWGHLFPSVFILSPLPLFPFLHSLIPSLPSPPFLSLPLKSS